MSDVAPAVPDLTLVDIAPTLDEPSPLTPAQKLNTTLLAQLKHAADAVRADLLTYESLRNVSEVRHMATQAVFPFRRRILRGAGAAQARSYSSHSLRRGFAGWASANGWDLKELMEHVGLRDVSWALRYIDVPRERLKGKFERALNRSAAVIPPDGQEAYGRTP